jgi:hypothetical protein
MTAPDLPQAKCPEQAGLSSARLVGAADVRPPGWSSGG